MGASVNQPYQLRSLTINEEHRPGCRTLFTEYQRGWARGFGDESPIPYWCYGKYSEEYVRGYLAGKAEIDGLADAAAQAECSYERYD